MMKKILSLFTLFSLLIAFHGHALALDSNAAIQAYSAELVVLGLEQVAADQKATADVNALVGSMAANQAEVTRNFEAIKERVDNIPKNDLRRDDGLSALDTAEELMDAFVDMEPSQNIFLQESVGGALPRVLPGDNFTLAQESAEGALASINRILIAPTRPGVVPEGDIISDFIPQIVRQLFRFAWLAVLIAFTVSGVFLVIAHGNEERVTKAKGMIYFSLVGFAFISLAFALVKAVTDIDFFRFI